MTQSSKQVKKPGRAPAPEARRWLWVLGGLVVVWMIGEATLLDARLGLRAGSARGYLTLARRHNPGPPHEDIRLDTWELEVAAQPGGEPFATFGLFLDRIPRDLERSLTAAGVAQTIELEKAVHGGGHVVQWRDHRHPYRVEFAGLSGRVVTRVVPTDGP